jgi:hypothetical protein
LDFSSPDGDRMYRSKPRQQLEFSDFYLPFSGHLDPENRWIALARLVPWELAEAIYHSELCEDFGAPIVPARVALGALLIKERLGLTDRETVEAIQENPYLQFFIGLEEFTQDRPFDASLMVDFRKRFGEEGMQRIAEAIALTALREKEAEATTSHSDPCDPPSDCHATESGNATAKTPASTHRGKLIVDATCAPADVRYPTDVGLLNEAREKADELIDELHVPLVGTAPRPRTYRVKARRAFVAFARKKQPSRRAIRRAQKQQLGFLRRNLQAIDRLLDNPAALPLSLLSRRMYKNLLVCREVSRQQGQMLANNSKRVDDRIVSISQPHVRPIKRGKAGRATEFGAKLSLSVVNGFSFVDHLSWDNYNESLDLKEQIQRYQRRFGFYPESVHADKIYRTRDNRAFCKQHGIRLSGPPLGRPPKDVSAADKEQASLDEAIRNRVEGKFGQAKRRFGLARVMAKLASTSAAQISLSFLVMNLEEALKRFLFLLALWCQGFARRILANSHDCSPPLTRQTSSSSANSYPSPNWPKTGQIVQSD